MARDPASSMRFDARIAATVASIAAGSIVAGSFPASPSSTARSVAWPMPVSASEPYSSTCNSRNAIEHAGFTQPAGKAARRAHRTHGVRTRRPNANLVEIEKTRRHA